MTVHLKPGESISLTTRRVTRTPLPHTDPVHMFRTPSGLRNNNLNALRNVFELAGQTHG